MKEWMRRMAKFILIQPDGGGMWIRSFTEDEVLARAPNGVTKWKPDVMSLPRLELTPGGKPDEPDWPKSGLLIRGEVVVPQQEPEAENG